MTHSEQTNQVILEAKNLSKSFTQPERVSIFQNISLQIQQGDSVAIMGRSGEGKSTLLQVLGTLEPPCSGSLSIAQQEVSMFNKSRIRSRHVGFIFQSFHLLEDYTALENILMPARIARKNINKGSEAYLRAWHLLEKVGLADRGNFYTKLLSGGEKQRVAIARALCNDPDIILADEPSGNLDKRTASGIHDLLLSFVNEHHKTLLVVTHDKDLAKLCNKLYLLENGALTTQPSL